MFFSSVFMVFTCVVLPQQVKTRSGGYLDHGGEGIGGKEFDTLLFRPLGRMLTSPTGLWLDSSAYDREVGTMECLRNDIDLK